jgi:hypothetical protein
VGYPPRLSDSDEMDPAVGFPHSLQNNFQVAIAHESRKLFSPLDQQDAVGCEQVVQAEGFQLALGIDPVQVDVIEGGSRAAIFVDEGKGGAGNVLSGSGLEAFCDALDEGGFAGAQIATQQDDERRGKPGRELASEGDGLGRGVSEGVARHRRGPSIATSEPLGRRRSSEPLWCSHPIGYRIEEAAIKSGIERHAQPAVVIVAQGNEAKGLQAGTLKLAHWRQHFGHAVYSTVPGVKGDLHKITGGESARQLEQTAGDGNSLKFGTRPLATFGNDGRGD